RITTARQRSIARRKETRVGRPNHARPEHTRGRSIYQTSIPRWLELVNGIGCHAHAYSREHAIVHPPIEEFYLPSVRLGVKLFSSPAARACSSACWRNISSCSSRITMFTKSLYASAQA